MDEINTGLLGVDWLHLGTTDIYYQLKNDLSSLIRSSEDYENLDKEIRKVFEKYELVVEEDPVIQKNEKKDCSLEGFLQLVRKDVQGFIDEIVINDIVRSYYMYGYFIRRPS